ncbi:hypothetical protein D3C77_415300 [compost metagenome]
MPKTNILQCRIAVEVLLSFFQINIVFMVIRLTGVAHILLYVEVNAPDGVDKLDKALKVGIDVILNRDAKQLGDRFHCLVGAVGNGRIDAIRAVAWYFNISITHNREQIGLLLYGINGGDHHRVGSGDFPLLESAGVHAHQQDIDPLGAFPFRGLGFLLGLNRLNIVEGRFLAFLLEFINLIVNGDKIISRDGGNGDQNPSDGPDDRPFCAFRHNVRSFRWITMRTVVLDVSHTHPL